MPKLRFGISSKSLHETALLILKLTDKLLLLIQLRNFHYFFTLEWIRCSFEVSFWILSIKIVIVVAEWDGLWFLTTNSSKLVDKQQIVIYMSI